MSDSRSEYYDGLREREREKARVEPDSKITTSYSRLELMITLVCEAGYSVDSNILTILKLLDSKLPQ